MAQKAKSGAKKSSAQGKKNAPAKKSTSSKASSSAKSGGAKPIRREVGATVCLFLGIFSVIGLFNVDAWFINIFCGFIKGLIGWGYYLFPAALLCCAYILFFHRGRPVVLRVTMALLAPVMLGSFAYLFTQAGEYDSFKAFVAFLYETGKTMAPGGVISGMISEGLRAAVSVYGAFPVLLVALLVCIGIALRVDVRMIAERYKSRERLEYEPEPEPVYTHTPKKQEPKEFRTRRAAIDIPLDEAPKPAEDKSEKAENTETPEILAEPEQKSGFFNRTPRVKTPDQLVSEHKEQRKEPPAVQPTKTGRRFDTVEQTENVEPLSIEQAAEIAGVTIESAAAPVSETKTVTPEMPAEKKVATTTAADKPSAEEVRQETEKIAKTIDEASQEQSGEEYRYPPVELLNEPPVGSVDGREEISLNRERLETTLHSFGVAANIVGVTRGPTVTRYDLELEVGVKLNKLTNLAGDIALSLGVSNVRIAPIPDKISTVGIEVPNKLVSTVYLRELIESDNFKKAKSKLSFAIGKDIAGNCIVGNISKLPHMLIAGTTGSGKSVCMNSLILSLIYKSTPEEVRLIMIDPKMVELGIYNGIPHLYIPVVTDPKKAAGALQWSVIEMLKRYRLFSEIGVRDLATYNEHQKKAGEPILPQVVIVIDELADLMLVASKEVEESICRVAQMGRAAGMHLIIATQRPSADVITGLMKANIPSRIAFAVSSAMESRIILDTGGAEKLIGMGDMLYAPLGSGKPLRVQGAFVTDEEREEVINFVKAGATANYSDEIIAQIEKAAEDKSAAPAGGKDAEEKDASPFSEYDELLPQAVDVIFETKQASVSMLQRKLKLGYSRAARLVDQMEEIGVVGPFEGSKPRQIVMTREQWQEMQMINGTAPVETDENAPVSFADYEDVPEEEWND
jgi:S-DNA-T family DNA segregation ATPase FtsK/SpoIIIE